MTLSEMKASDKVMLLAKDVAGVMGCHPYAITLAARDGDLPFPYFFSGNRVKIPRLPFLRWVTGEYTSTGWTTGEEVIKDEKA